MYLQLFVFTPSEHEYWSCESPLASSASHGSPVKASLTPQSPTGVTFTFPALPDLHAPADLSDHYLRPSNNQPARDSFRDTRGSFRDVRDSIRDTRDARRGARDSGIESQSSTSFSTSLGGPCYVNMSTDAAGDDDDDDGDDEGASEGAEEDGYDVPRGVTMRSRSDDELHLSAASNRLSGLSALSAMSGMTSASTVDFDRLSSHTAC